MAHSRSTVGEPIGPPQVPYRNQIPPRCPTWQSAPVESDAGSWPNGKESRCCHHSVARFAGTGGTFGIGGGLPAAYESCAEEDASQTDTTSARIRCFVIAMILPSVPQKCRVISRRSGRIGPRSLVEFTSADIGSLVACKSDSEIFGLFCLAI